MSETKAHMKLTVEQLDELETLAKAATQGGWRAGRGDMHSYDGATGEPFKNVYGPNFEPELHHGNRIPLEVAKATGGNCMADAQFISAAHPEVVLALVAAARASLESRGDATTCLNHHCAFNAVKGTNFCTVHAFDPYGKRPEVFCETCGGTGQIDNCHGGVPLHATAPCPDCAGLSVPSTEVAESMAGWASGRNSPKSESRGERAILLKACRWMHERGHKSAATDLDYNWNDTDQPGNGTCMPLHKSPPAEGEESTVVWRTVLDGENVVQCDEGETYLFALQMRDGGWEMFVNRLVWDSETAPTWGDDDPGWEPSAEMYFSERPSPPELTNGR